MLRDQVISCLAGGRNKMAADKGELALDTSLQR